MWIQLPEEIDTRLKIQCNRFRVSESMFMKMALIKLLEEEEANQEALKKKKLIPKSGT